MNSNPAPNFGDRADLIETPEELRAIGARTIAESPIESCPVCEANNYKSYAVGFDYELMTCANPWRFVKCRECNHLWLNPRPALSELSTIYPPHYYAYDFESRVNPIALYGKAMLDRLKMRGIFRSLPRPMRSFLDVGCGSGRYLQLAEARGVSKQSIYGLELDAGVIKKLREQGYQAFAERVETCNEIPTQAIDLAVMFHVIEHVDNPLAVVLKIREWLSKDGVLALETPNLDSLDARLFKDSFWGGYHIPRHWNLFTPATISRLLERAGMKVERISYQTGHSFWMYSLHHTLRYGKLKIPRLGKLFDPLTGLPFLVMFTGFDKLRAALSAKTSSMLVIARPA